MEPDLNYINFFSEDLEEQTTINYNIYFCWDAKAWTHQIKKHECNGIKKYNKKNRTDIIAKNNLSSKNFSFCKWYYRRTGK